MTEQSNTPEIVAPATNTPVVIDPLAAALELIAAQSGLTVADLMARMTAPVATPKVAAPKPATNGESTANFIEATDPFAVLFGITNDHGRLISRSYLKAYVQCNCRLPDGFKDQPTISRKELFNDFVSDGYLTECVAAGIKTAGGIGKRASLDARWNRPAPVAKPKVAKPVIAKPTAATPIVAPLTAEPPTDADAEAFAANMANADQPAPVEQQITHNTRSAANGRRERLAEALVAANAMIVA
jgi:hypothetical protein